MPQVNHSLNGIPGTLWEIRRQENIHPYLGLRQAILIIDSKEKALREGRLNKKKAFLNIEKLKTTFLTVETDNLEIRKDELAIAEHNIQTFDQLILDAEMELKVAQEEKQRIETCNPDMATLTYNELQAKYANAAFRCKLARTIAISTYSRAMQLPEGISEVIYDTACLPEAEKQEILSSSTQQFYQLLGSTTESQAVPQLSILNENTNGFTTN